MKYVVIGASAAGISGIKELRKLDQKSEIILISKDQEIYSRCILCHYLSGIRNVRQLNFTEHNFEQLYGVNWIRGMACVGIHPTTRTVILEDGQQITYDKLLIASGSKTVVPRIEHLEEAKNVVGFRNLEDVDYLKRKAGKGKAFVVLGAGLVGMDCITGLIDLGVKVTMVEKTGWLLSKYLDERAAKTYRDVFAQKGIEQHYGTTIKKVRLNEAKEVDLLYLDNGIELPCDHLIIATGAAANIDFLKGSGIELTQTGLLFDDRGRTSDHCIYGAGDVSGLRPVWSAAVKEGIVAANSMVGKTIQLTEFFATKATMNYFGIPTMSLGEATAGTGVCQIEMRETDSSYKKIAHRNGRIVGAILQGDLAYGGILQQLIANRIDVGRVKKSIFEIDYSDFFNMDDNFEFYYNES